MSRGLGDVYKRQNIMGASKRLCEMVIQSMDAVSKSGRMDLLPLLHGHRDNAEELAKQAEICLKKAEKEGKTEYLVFFKAKDVDVMTAAFKEYTGVSLKKEQRQSIRKKLEQAKERVAKHREITKEKTKDRGQVR